MTDDVRQAWIGPMLAMPHKEVVGNDGDPTSAMMLLDDADEYTFDVKWDGVRCIAYIDPFDGTGTTLVNRNLRNINERYPDIIHALNEQFSDGTPIILDGEIVVFNEDGKPDFGLVSRRDRVGSAAAAAKAAERLPATFVAFDLLFYKDGDFRKAGYNVRRAMLEAHVERVPGITVSPTSTDGATMWNFCLDYGVEGLIAKRNESPYRSGRSPDWVKVKQVHRVSCLVTGYEKGTGRLADSMGALLLGLLDPNDPSTVVDAGKVGTGFTDRDRENFKDLLGRIDLTHDPIVVEVEYANLTDDGALRFPSYKGLRSDIDPDDCTTDQLK